MTGTSKQAIADDIDIGAQAITREQSRNSGQCTAAHDDFTAWLTASCARQAVPVTITDHATLAAIATLLS
jgi:hypothetical protein